MPNPLPTDDTQSLLSLLNGIQAVAGALSNSHTIEQAADTMVRDVVPRMGAVAGVVALVEGGDKLRCLRLSGYDQAAQRHWETFPITAPVAVAIAIRERRTVAHASRDDFAIAYPEFEVGEGSPAGARLAVPLLLDGRAIGGIGLAYAAEREFSEAEIRCIETVALLCAQAIDRARLQEAEAAARCSASAEREKLTSAYEHLRLTSQAVGLATWEWNARTNEVYWSRAYQDLYGIDYEAAPSFEIGIGSVVPEDRAEVLEGLRVCLEGRGEFETEHRILHPQLGLRWIRGLGRFVPDERGDDTKLVGVVWDATEQHRASETVRQSEARYRGLVDATSAIVWTADPSGEFVQEQPSWSAYTGQTPDQYRGWGRLDAIHPDDRDRICREWERASTECATYEAEERVWSAAGADYRWHRARAVPIHFADGSTVREWVGMLEDVHDHKLREQALTILNDLDELIRVLREPEDLLTSAVKLLGERLSLGHCHFAEVDWQRDHTYTHPGYAHDTVDVSGLEAPASSFGPPAFLKALQSGKSVAVGDVATHDFTRDRYLEAFVPLQVGAFVMVPCMRDGVCVSVLVADSQAVRKWHPEEMTLLETAAARIWLSVENTRLFRAAQKELDERRRTEQTLQTSEERLRLAIEGAELGTTHWDLKTGEVVWSESMLRLFGIPADRVGDLEDVMSCVHPDDKAMQAERARRILTGQTDGGLEYRVVWPDGSVHWVQSRGRVYLDENGTPARFEGVVQDITRRKEAERAVEESRNQLQLITDAAPLLISYVDRERIFRFNNGRYEAWF